MNKQDPNLRERVLFLFSPKRANKVYRDRLLREGQNGSDGKSRMAATGYGNHGASTTLNSMVGWLVGGGSAEDDIDLHGALLRQRARDLYAGGGLARSGPATLTTNVVGWGIQPKPKIDGEALGLTDEARDEWERNTLREFRLWAENPMCDAERQQNFYGLQQLAFLSELVSGDVFVLFGMKENKRTPYTTTLRVLEADRVSTPDSQEGESESTETENGGRIVDGVEIDKEGAVIRYHIASRHPLMENTTAEIEWIPIDATQPDTPNTPETPTKITLGARLLKRGSKGDDVTELQRILVGLGYDLGTYGPDGNGVDGDYGAATEKAVRKFQSTQQIMIDGVYGNTTHAALMGVLADKDAIEPDDGGDTPTEEISGKRVEVTGENVNVRTGPATTYKIITRVNAGDAFPFVATAEAYDWHAVEVGGKIGWISGKYSVVKG